MGTGTSSTGMGAGQGGGWLDGYFGLRRSGTSVKTEAIAGATTFLTMAYIIFVNPSILSTAGIDYQALVAVTCLASGIMTILMGVWANVPIALAPGMGLNAFVAFTLVGHFGLTWQQALGFVFISGLITVALTFFQIRELIVRVIPTVLKRATAVGIGLFIAFLGFKNIGLIVPDPATYLTYTKHWTPHLILSLVGFSLMGIFIIYRVRGAILLGILVVTVLGLGLRALDYQLHSSQLAGRPWLRAVPAGLQGLGVQADDVILSVGGRNIGSLQDLGSLPPGAELTQTSAITGAEPSAGTILSSNPPAGVVPAAAPIETPKVDVVVSRSRLFVMREEHVVKADAGQLDLLKSQVAAGALGTAGAVSYIGLPTAVVSMPQNLDKTFFQFSLQGILSATFLAILISYVFVDLFDTLGTLIAVGYKAGLTDEDGNLPQIREALQVDSWAAVVAASMGTSSVTSYIESAAGVEEGGKTGLTAVFCGLFFLAAMFFVPLIGVVPSYAISPCLIIVGLAMLDHISAINWTDYEEAIPAFMTIMLMPLAHNISVGLGFGFLSYLVIKVAVGKWKEVHPVLIVVCALFVLNLAFGG